MDIQLLQTTDPPNKLNKTVIEVATITVTLKDNTDFITPVIRLSPSYISTAFNYVYIPDFNRYYYLNGKGVLIGKLVEYTLRVDVLMSWKAAIKDSTVIASRSTNNGNKLLPDSIPLLAKRNVLYKRLTGGITATGKFGSDVVDSTSPSILLTVINGRGEAPGGSITLNTPVVNDNLVSLTWTKVEGAEKYYVYRKGENESDYKVIAMPAVQLYDDLIEVSGTYMYYVRAFSNFALGEPSNTVSATVTVGGITYGNNERYVEHYSGAHTHTES